jgi:hypothetical protein
MEDFIKEDERVLFQIELIDKSDHRVEFNIHEVVSWGENYEVLETEKYLYATMKWDGCHHFWFGESEGYLHLCGKTYIERHIKVMQTCLKYAEDNIEKFDKELAQ